MVGASGTVEDVEVGTVVDGVEVVDVDGLTDGELPCPPPEQKSAPAQHPSTPTTKPPTPHANPTSTTLSENSSNKAIVRP